MNAERSIIHKYKTVIVHKDLVICNKFSESTNYFDFDMKDKNHKNTKPIDTYILKKIKSC